MSPEICGQDKVQLGDGHVGGDPDLDVTGRPSVEARTQS